MAITAMIPIEMAFTQYYESEYATTWFCTEVEIDPADYPGLTHAYFEANMENGLYDDEAHPLQLVDDEGTVYATLTPTQNDQDFERVRAEFTWNTSSTKYYVRTAYEGSSWCYLVFANARIMLEIEDSDDALIEVPLIAGNLSSPGCDAIGGYGEDISNWWAWCGYSTKSDGYGYKNAAGYAAGADDRAFVIFRKDESAYSVIDHWEFEVIAGLMADEEETMTSGEVALFNKTTGQMVTGSAISFEFSDNPYSDSGYNYCLPYRKSVVIANNAENFTDGNDFEFRMKITGDTVWYGVLVYSVKIKVKVVHATAAQIYLRTSQGVGNYYGSGTALSSYDWYLRTIYEPSKFSTLGEIYFEVTGSEEGGGGASMWLHEVGTQDYGNVQSRGIGRTINAAVDGVQPPVDADDWHGSGAFSAVTAEDLENYEGGPIVGGAKGSLTLTTANQESPVVQLSGFDYNPQIASDAVISEVRAYVVVGSARGVTAGTLNGYLKGEGVAQAVAHSSNVTECESAGSDYIAYAVSQTLTSDDTWTVQKVLDLALQFYFKQGASNNDSTLYWIDQITAIIGLHRDISGSKSDFVVGTRGRVRSSDISSELVENTRYITHYYGYSGNTIKANCMSFLVLNVTGTYTATTTGERAIEYFMPHELFSEIKDAFFVHCGLTWYGGAEVEVTGITNADPAVVSAPDHGFSNGDYVQLQGIKGMTEINNHPLETSAYVIGNVTTNTFELTDVDSTAYGIFIGGSTVRQVTNLITGLPTGIYYVGQDIRVVGDGTYVYNGVITTAGQVSLPFYANKIHAGLPFQTTIEPMNPMAGNRQGTIRGKKQKINRVTLCLYETVGCKVGINQDLLLEIPIRDPGWDEVGEPCFEAGILLTEDLTVDLEGEWEDKATVSIVHDEPLPFTIKAIVPHVDSNEP